MEPKAPIPNKLILAHLHCAALILGGTALFSKLIELPAIDIIAYRTLICGAIVLSIALALKQKVILRKPRHFALAIGCSILFAIHWSTYFHAMQTSSVAIGIVSMFTFPVITVFLEPLFTKARIQAYDLAMGFLVLLGVFLMVPSFDLSNNITEGVMFGLVSALAVALRNLLVTRYLSAYSPLTLMAYHGFISFLVLIPLASVSISEIQTKDWLLLIALASIFTAIPHTQITHGLQNWPAKKVSMIISLQVVYASVFAFLLLSEILSWQSLLGGCFILVAALGESVKKHA
jgi:drug/metabolite transporter (DMT)-like permease